MFVCGALSRQSLSLLIRLPARGEMDVLFFQTDKKSRLSVPASVSVSLRLSLSLSHAHTRTHWHTNVSRGPTARQTRPPRSHECAPLRTTISQSAENVLRLFPSLSLSLSPPWKCSQETHIPLQSKGTCSLSRQNASRVRAGDPRPCGVRPAHRKTHVRGCAGVCMRVCMRGLLTEEERSVSPSAGNSGCIARPPTTVGAGKRPPPLTPGSPHRAPQPPLCPGKRGAALWPFSTGRRAARLSPARPSAAACLCLPHTYLFCKLESMLCHCPGLRPLWLTQQPWGPDGDLGKDGEGAFSPAVPGAHGLSGSCADSRHLARVGTGLLAGGCSVRHPTVQGTRCLRWASKCPLTPFGPHGPAREDLGAPSPRPPPLQEEAGWQAGCTGHASPG